MKHIKAPQPYFRQGSHPTVFLAGSIEMGSAEKWQDKVVRELDSYKGLILNPRRDDWDSSWKQEASNEQFSQQVKWELNGLARADIIAMYFDPSTKSPITLLELGLHAKSHKVFVCCPDGYFRQGNVEITCSVYSVPFFTVYDEWVIAIKSEIETYS